MQGQFYGAIHWLTKLKEWFVRCGLDDAAARLYFEYTPPIMEY
jgi:hypothetical protein